jgi:hypothetical protein
MTASSARIIIKNACRQLGIDAVYKARYNSLSQIFVSINPSAKPSLDAVQTLKALASEHNFCLEFKGPHCPIGEGT